MVQISLSDVPWVSAAFTIGDLSGCVHSIAFLEVFKKLCQKNPKFSKWTKVSTGTVRLSGQPTRLDAVNTPPPSAQSHTLGLMVCALFLVSKSHTRLTACQATSSRTHSSEARRNINHVVVRNGSSQVTPNGHSALTFETDLGGSPRAARSLQHFGQR